MKEDLQGLTIDREKRQGHAAGGGGRVWFGISCLLFAALVGLSWYAFWWKPAPEAPAEAEAVEVADDPASGPQSPETQPEDREVLIASGYVVAHHKHELGSKVMGRIQWIGVEKGDFVRKGQLLVKLEDREYRAQLEQSKASLEFAEQRLAELERGARPQEIERAKADLVRARADRENARLDFERLKRLLGSGVMSQQEVDNARARFEMAAAAVDSARQTYDLLEEGTRSEEIRQARADVERTRAAVDYAQTMLDATEIRAPVSGTVLRRIAEVGEMLTTSFAGDSGAKSAAVALADLTDLQVEMDISQTDFGRINPDLACEMSPEAFPDRKYRCEIDEISPEANRQNASIQVKVKVLEPDDYLRPEMSARVTFLRRETEDNG